MSGGPDMNANPGQGAGVFHDISEAPKCLQFESNPATGVEGMLTGAC